MRTHYRSPFQRLLGMLRFQWLRLVFRRKLNASGRGIIGSRCGFFLEEGGTALLKGKFAINEQVMIYSKGRLEIGRDFYANKYASIVAHERITIGDRVSVGQFVTILDHDHDIMREANGVDIRLEGFVTAPVSIGNNVWIGNHCTVLKGVQIGDNVIVGANTLVHKDVPSNCLIMGVPFKIIKKI